ncbi:MAG: hypothetical protein ACOC6F_03375 [bacterium]
MRNFETYCDAPALCDECGRLHVLNYLNSTNRCPECGKPVVFYDDPSLFSLPAGQSGEITTVFSWTVAGEAEPFVLLDVGYLCPKCREMRMRFVRADFWD